MNIGLYMIGVLFIMIYLHEFGHWIALKQFGSKERFSLLKFEYDTTKLSKRKKDAVALIGILFGFIGLLFVNTEDIYFALIFFGYVYGCMSDIKSIDWSKLNDY